MSDLKFNKILGCKDIFAMAFGAMIGWGWVIMSGKWIEKAGSIGAIIAFLLGGTTIVFIGLIYAELTAAMPKCGGEHVFSLRALGKTGSFICTWAIILGYVGVVCFEACALPSVIEYLIPNFKFGYMYTIAGFDVYFSWVLIGVISSILITLINCIGLKAATKIQRLLTICIVFVGVMLIVGTIFSGEIKNINPCFENGIGGVLSVCVMTPFMFVGFDVIPQTADEVNISYKKLGKVIVLSIVVAILWYISIIFSVSVLLSKQALAVSELATVDAMKKAYFNSGFVAKVVVVGGVAGILSSWNSFFIGGSRAIFALSESRMLPTYLSKISYKTKTPINSVVLIGIISIFAPFFGKAMMIWLTNAGSFGVVIAYFITSISFLILRIKEPNMKRPYKIKHGKLVGALAVLFSGVMIVLYLPGMSSCLALQEIVIILIWIILGILLFSLKKKL